jgi:hypothetical protein
MNVQELCDALVDRRQKELDAVEKGKSEVPVETFDAALTEEWLADNIKQIATLANKVSEENEWVGNLEINAFLAAFQRAVEGMRTPRIKRWANRFTFKKRTKSEETRDADGKLVAVGGALQEQLRSLGVKVDNEFVTYLNSWHDDPISDEAVEGIG